MLTTFTPRRLSLCSTRWFTETAVPKIDPTAEKVEDKPNQPTSPSYADLEKMLKTTQEDLKKLQNESLYLMADIKNMQRIHSEDLIEFRTTATSKLASELLPVIDNIERIVEVGTKQSVKDILDGVKMVDSQFLAALRKFDITKMEPLDKPFDPKYHTALATIEFGDKVKSGMVGDVSLNGYMIGKKVLRSAKVAVAK